ncbi:MAG TPA: hypothetical protein PLP57_09475 [Candidatus Saccharicenans sp.]|nr:hypothetical protein [Candidatus Saccharicenans sp.]HRD02850.1 hypothetical protein [Candidatus Saccharicenans sp.]
MIDMTKGGAGWKKGFLFIICLASLVASTCSYLGYYHFNLYESEKRSMRSVERDFEKLQGTLQKAVSWYPSPEFYLELGRLRLLRAMGEIEFGQPEESEFYLNQASEALKRAVYLRPVDYAAFWELSKAYFLMNYPLPIYADKGRQLCWEAIKRAPHDEFLVSNALVVFFEQWLLLSEEEKTNIEQKIKDMEVGNPGFLERFKRKWRIGHGEETEFTLRLKELGF